jgi:hypothetical protein
MTHSELDALQLDALLSAIDEVAVHQCGTCGIRLDEKSPSSTFCDEKCQHQWHDMRYDAAEENDGYGAYVTDSTLQTLLRSIVEETDDRLHEDTHGRDHYVLPVLRERDFYAFDDVSPLDEVTPSHWVVFHEEFTIATIQYPLNSETMEAFLRNADFSA